METFQNRRWRCVQRFVQTETPPLSTDSAVRLKRKASLAITMAFIANILLDFQENAAALRHFIGSSARDGKSDHSKDYARKRWLEYYQHAVQPRVPAGITELTPNTIMLLCVLANPTRIQGVTRLPHGTKLLLAATFLPFLKPGGFSLPKLGLSPFMVCEHRQWYRMLTAGFHHVDIEHAGQYEVLLSATCPRSCMSRSHNCLQCRMLQAWWSLQVMWKADCTGVSLQH